MEHGVMDREGCPYSGGAEETSESSGRAQLRGFSSHEACAAALHPLMSAAWNAPLIGCLAGLDGGSLVDLRQGLSTKQPLASLAPP